MLWHTHTHTHTHTLVNMVTLLYNNVLGTVRLLSYFELRWFILLRLFCCLFKIRWWPLSFSLSFPSFFHSQSSLFSVCVYLPPSCPCVPPVSSVSHFFLTFCLSVSSYPLLLSTSLFYTLAFFSASHLTILRATTVYHVITCSHTTASVL